MMTQQIESGIVAAPLAQIDRRTLSQAWYSALHLAQPQAPRPPSSRTPAAAEPGPKHSSFAAAKRAGVARAAVKSSLSFVSAEKRFDTSIEAEERRTSKIRLAKRIAHAALSFRTIPVRSALTLRHGEGRVYLILQNANGRLRLIAICRPADRDAVAGAVARARVALAMRGCELEVKTGAFACS